MLQQEVIQRLADEIHRAGQNTTPIAPFTQAYPELTIEDAREIQLINIRRRMAAGAKMVGKKVGATNPVMQEKFNLREPVLGYLLSDIIRDPSQPIRRDTQIAPFIECEILFVLAERLPDALGLPFVQEVIASSKSIAKTAPQTDVAIELGGEDAKILYFGRSIDLRMNEACAGGTGAFIDQMAALLHTDTLGLNTLASHAKAVHPIASRCGVFAKTDLVSLLNEGVPREDLAVSVLQAVVEQTISGLACGQPIKGSVAFLGGPLHFLPELVKRFALTLGLSPEQTLTFPDGQYMVALGASLAARDNAEAVPISTLLVRLKDCASPLLLSDVGCAAAACRGALLSASYNIFVNTKSYADDEEAQGLNAAAKALMQDALPKLEDVELQVLLALQGEEV